MLTYAGDRSDCAAACHAGGQERGRQRASRYSVYLLTSTKVQILTQLRYAGGLYVMGICTEHCCESYTEMLDMLMPLLLAGLRDSNKEVTYADVCWRMLTYADAAAPAGLRDRNKEVTYADVYAAPPCADLC